jgi:hypothetical protein
MFVKAKVLRPLATSIEISMFDVPILTIPIASAMPSHAIAQS